MLAKLAKADTDTQLQSVPSFPSLTLSLPSTIPHSSLAPTIPLTLLPSLTQSLTRLVHQHAAVVGAGPERHHNSLLVPRRHVTLEHEVGDTTR